MTMLLTPQSDSTPLVGDSLAFGVDPTRHERYSLRQGRYQAIGDVLAQESQRLQAVGAKLKLLDVGVWNGISMRYIEPRVPHTQIEYHGVDLKLHAGIYRREDWASLQEGNLLDGMPHLPSETYDVLICEQVVEHLPTIDVALQTLSRVVKPGGLLILGVPIFPPGVHLLRKHLVPAIDKLVGTKKVRGHLQAFSRLSFERAVLKNCDVDILASRGFRMISGGLLRSLENQHWWWRLNRHLGYRLPGLCTEIQVVARKRGTPLEATLPLSRAA
ncbi:methyltransferase domain-containing protein [bacterium]|nr:methyltransferase domain-containing protein [bacterium]